MAKGPDRGLRQCSRKACSEPLVWSLLRFPVLRQKRRKRESFRPGRWPFHSMSDESCITTRPRVLTPAPRTMARITQIAAVHWRQSQKPGVNSQDQLVPRRVLFRGNGIEQPNDVETPCNLPVPILVLVRDVAVNGSSGRRWKNARGEMCTSSGAKAAVTLKPLRLEKMTKSGQPRSGKCDVLS